MSVAGVTGARGMLPTGLEDFVHRARAVTDKPLCVGFGIANAESARRVSEIADGIIVGSALVSKIGDSDSAVEKTRSSIRELEGAIG